MAIGLVVAWVIAEVRQRLDELIGLQLPSILDDLRGESPRWLIGVGLAVSGVVITTRLVYQFAITALIRAVDRRPSQRARRATWQARLVGGWAEMRGAVSLAAALALPPDAPHRELLVFLAFCVILVTPVLQGLTLPMLIRGLRVHDDGGGDHEELKARLVATQAALERIGELGEESWTRDDTIERLRGADDYRRRRLKARAGAIEDDGHEDRSEAYQRIVREVLESQRRAVVAMRNEGRISNDVMHRIERELDLEDQRLEI